MWPTLSSIMLPNAVQRQRRDAPLVALLKTAYRWLLPPLLRHPRITFGVAAAVTSGLLLLITGLGEELMPKFKETDFLMHWVEKPGIGIDAMDRITARVSEELMKVDGVLNFGSHIGPRRSPTRLWVNGQASLGDVADVVVTPAPNEIKREGSSRQHRCVVQCGAARSRQRGPRHRTTCAQ